MRNRRAFRSRRIQAHSGLTAANIGSWEPMAKKVVVATHLLLMDAGIVEIYAMGNVAAGSVLFMASFFALGFAFGFGSGGE